MGSLSRCRSAAKRGRNTYGVALENDCKVICRMLLSRHHSISKILRPGLSIGFAQISTIQPCCAPFETGLLLTPASGQSRPRPHPPRQSLRTQHVVTQRICNGGKPSSIPCKLVYWHSRRRYFTHDTVFVVPSGFNVDVPSM